MLEAEVKRRGMLKALLMKLSWSDRAFLVEPDTYVPADAAHQTDHCHGDPGFAALRRTFILFSQTTIAVEPRDQFVLLPNDAVRPEIL